MRIGIVAPSTPILPDDAEAVRAIAALGYPGVELIFDEHRVKPVLIRIEILSVVELVVLVLT